MQPTPRTDTPPDGEKVNILLVDDQPASLLAMRAILEDLGHHLVEAGSGEEALRRLAADDFAVVLLDVQMRGLDGFETARRVRAREQSRHTPVIFLTAYEDRRFPVEEAYALGAVDYLVKPLVPVILRAKVTGFVELYRQTRQIQQQAEQLRHQERRDFERQLAEENARLRESLAYHRAIAELTSDFAYSARTEPGGTVVLESATEGFAKVTGYTLEELNAEGGWAAVILPEDLPVTARAIGRILEGQKQENEVRFRTKGGAVRWVRFLGHPTWDDAHRRVVGILGAVKDITDRKQAEEAVRESELRFRQLAESINEVFWMADPRTTEILYVSPAYEQIWGRSCQSLYANPREFLDAVHPDDRERVRAAALEKHRRGEATDEEYRVLRPDGSVRWVRDRGFPIRDEAGRVYRFAGLAEDVTERKEADRRKDDFLAMLAHELRNPLAPVRNALEILKAPGLDVDTRRRARDMMERQVQHLVRLVDDLLDVSRVMRNRIELHRERLDLGTVFARAVETAQPAIDALGHQLRVSLPPEPVRLEGDLIRLAQVVGNLLLNAAKYTERGGRIELTGTREGGAAVIRVRDTGVGIGPELLPRIFEPFTQADQSLARSQGGLGIGLTVVKHLVGMHGGSVYASSAGPGRGSEFVVRLPTPATGTADPAADPEGMRAPPAGTRRRVLVVDDSADVAESTAMLLRLLGHEVRTAPDGPAALAAVPSFRPEVVLLDIGLPGMSGYDVARALRAQPDNAGLVLVAVTGYGQEEDRRRSTEVGIDRHLVKPVDPAALEDALRAAPEQSEPDSPSG